MIYIVTDTNYLNCSFKSGVDFSCFRFNKNFSDLLDLKEDPDCIDVCRVCLPEMVYQELVQHKNEAYKERLKKLEELSVQMGKFMSYKVEVPLDEYMILNKKMADQYIEERHILKIPFCRDHFDNMIQDAIHKLPPFEGVKGKSDKGFKDVVIWYSTIEYAQEHPGDYLFISNDNIFIDNKKMLSDMFEKETGCRIRFCKNVLEVQQKVLKPKDSSLESVRITSSIKEWEFWTDQNVDLHVSWDYPYIEDNGIKSLQYINNDICDIYETVLKEWKNWHCENTKNPEDICLEEGYSDELKYEILLNQDGLLCIRFSQYVYLGGPHGTPVWHIRLYNLNTGQKLKLRDVVSGTDEEIYELIEKRFKEEKEQHCNYDHRPFYFPDFTLEYYQNIEDFKFFVSPEGVHIYFDVYEAGPYSEGFINFIISDKWRNSAEIPNFENHKSGKTVL